MSVRSYRGRLGGAASLIAILWMSPAFAHAVCGDRIFPATLGIDDPGVGDELALPTITAQPLNSSNQQEFDASFSYTKTIFPGFGLSIGDGPSWVTSNSQAEGGYGWGNISTEAKYNFLCLAEHEFMASAGVSVDWANTNINGMGNSYNTYTPVLDIGKGFGDLPTSLNVFRPLAITAEISEDIPGQYVTGGAQNPVMLNWGFTIQYSLPYLNSHVSAIDNGFLKHLIPITEFTFSKPVANFLPGSNVTTGTIQPGAIYMADTWQFALEAIVPINAASGHNIGIVGELHFFFDDIFPKTLGKPIFGGAS